MCVLCVCVCVCVLVGNDYINRLYGNTFEKCISVHIPKMRAALAKSKAAFLRYLASIESTHVWPNSVRDSVDLHAVYGIAGGVARHVNLQQLRAGSSASSTLFS